METALRWIDRANELASNSVSLLFGPMAVLSVYEVFMRYAMNRPTTWVWEVNLHLFALMITLGAGHTLLKGGHVVMDIVTSRLSAPVRRVLRLVSLAVFVFAVGLIVREMASFAWRSVEIRERSSTVFDVAMYPTKLAVCAGVALLWLQGVSLFVRDLLLVRPAGGR